MNDQQSSNLQLKLEGQALSDLDLSIVKTSAATLLKTKKNFGGSIIIKIDIANKPTNTTFHIKNSKPITDADKIIVYVGEVAASHYSDILLFPTLLCEQGNANQPQANITSCSQQVMFINETSKNSMIVKQNTIKIMLDKNNVRFPSQYIFLPGTVTYHRKFTHSAGENYTIESIEFSNSILKKLYEKKIALNRASLEAAVDRALLEESEESRYQYFKTVAENISSTEFANKFKDAKKFAAYRLKHFSKILHFLSHTNLYIDDEFKKCIGAVENQIPDLSLKISRKTYQSLVLFLKSNELSYWPLTYAITTEDELLTNSKNSAIRVLHVNAWKHKDTNPDETKAPFFNNVFGENPSFTVNGAIPVITDEFLYGFLKNNIEKYPSFFSIHPFLKHISKKDVETFKNFSGISSKNKNDAKDYIIAALKENPIQYKNSDPFYSRLLEQWQKDFINYTLGNDEYTDLILKHYHNCTGKELFINCLKYDLREISSKTNIIVKCSHKSDFRIINGQPCIVSDISDIEINNTTISGNARVIFNLKTQQLVSIEASNASIRNLICKNNSQYLAENGLSVYLSKPAHIEEFKENFNDFKAKLHNNMMISLEKHRDEFISSMMHLAPKTDFFALENILNNYLEDLHKTFVKHARNDNIPELEDNISVFDSIFKNKAHQLKNKLNETLKTLHNANSNHTKQLSDGVDFFLVIAKIKATQAFTNQTIYNIASNGIRLADKYPNKACLNISLAQQLLKDSTVFYQQPADHYTKKRIGDFFTEKLIDPIEKAEPNLAAPRHLWVEPLANVAAVLLTGGIWGIALIGKAIYSAITITKTGQKFFGLTEQASPLLYPLTKSYGDAHHGRKNAEKLKDSLENLVETKSAPRKSSH